MRQHDGAQTLHYVDPPYVHSTRVMQSGKAGYYRHEMNEGDHQELLDCLRSLRGMVVVSGYRTDLYDAVLQDWRRVETRARISAGRGGTLRTECLWISPSASTSGHQQGLALEHVA
jgi:DNA adenine methylase